MFAQSGMKASIPSKTLEIINDKVELFADEVGDNFISEDSESLEPCSRLPILIAGDKVFQI